MKFGVTCYLVESDVQCDDGLISREDKCRKGPDCCFGAVM